MAIKKALVCGAGGFIGSHMVKRLRAEGYFVRGADLKHTEYNDPQQTILSLPICVFARAGKRFWTKAWMRSISSRRIWVAPAISLLGSTMPM